jgi:protocatechuate 3,4-dioxygenase beta subunit
MGKTALIDRRTALAQLGGFGTLGGLLLAGCTTESGNTVDAAGGGSDAADSNTGGVDAPTACTTQTPEGEIGPYFADDSATGFNRSDVRANLDGSEQQPGIPLALTIYVYDQEHGCAPISGVQIDIWHCNAAGVYSDIAAESTSTKQWLRGYQLTDATGKVQFTTIFPGWYQGRTTHIHARLRSSYSEASSTSDGTNTTQMFFAQTLIDMIATSVTPYNTEGTNSTTNASDHVYSGETDGANLLTLTGDTTNGYAAVLAIYLPIAAATSTGTGGGTPPGA